MRGYVILILIAVAVVLALPPLFLSETPTLSTDTAPITTSSTTETAMTDRTFSVLHTDGVTVSDIRAYDLTLYSVIGTVSAEVSPEVIKAQTVAMYSLFDYQKAHRTADAAADITQTVLPFPQGYSDTYWQQQWGEEYDRLMSVYRSAVDEVYGQQLLYEGEPIMALYHTMNGGKTEESDVLFSESLPYLRSVASPADALDERLLTTITIPASDAAPILKTLCGTDAIGIAETWFQESQKTDAGTVTAISVAGQMLSGVTIQQAFSLPSASFEVCVQDRQVIFTVQGNGHFVGMSLCGAQGMAQNGSTYREILSHYYTDAEWSA